MQKDISELKRLVEKHSKDLIHHQKEIADLRKQIQDLRNQALMSGGNSGNRGAASDDEGKSEELWLKIQAL